MQRADKIDSEFALVVWMLGGLGLVVAIGFIAWKPHKPDLAAKAVAISASAPAKQKPAQESSLTALNYNLQEPP